jgi:hypothetical protein
MTLTRLQENTLKQYQEYRTRETTVASFMIPAIPRFVVILILGIFAYALGYIWVGHIVSGALIGVFLRQLSLSITASKVTPILLEVIDWDVVDDLLASHT